MKSLRRVSFGVVGISVFIAFGAAMAGPGGPGRGGPGGGGYSGGHSSQQSLQRYIYKMQVEVQAIESTAARIKQMAKNRLYEGKHAVAGKAGRVYHKASSTQSLLKNIAKQRGSLKHKAKRLKDSGNHLSRAVQELRETARAYRAGSQAPRLRQSMAVLVSSVASFQSTVRRAVSSIGSSQRVLCRAKDVKEFNRPGFYTGISQDRYVAEQKALSQCRAQSSAYRPRCVVESCRRI